MGQASIRPLKQGISIEHEQSERKASSSGEQEQHLLSAVNIIGRILLLVHRYLLLQSPP